MYVCLCRGVTEAQINAAGSAGVRSAEALIGYFRWDEPDCCGFCARHILDIVAIAEGRASAMAHDNGDQSSEPDSLRDDPHEGASA